ncbi:hypothetical protein TNCV_3293851 [Trichonephila clavipes]|nr:hypothetical protein TNCV_3293851 [Trichonephila clavipes]
MALNIVVMLWGWESTVPNSTEVDLQRTELFLHQKKFSLEEGGVVANGPRKWGEGFPRIRFPYVPDRLVSKGHAEDRF